MIQVKYWIKFFFKLSIHQNSMKKIRCKYCCEVGHTGHSNCPDKAKKRPTSIPEWISKITCAKCKEKGNLAFNHLPMYENRVM